MYHWERGIRYFQRKPILFLIFFCIPPIVLTVLGIWGHFSLSVDLSKFKNTQMQETRVYDGMQGAIKDSQYKVFFASSAQLSTRYHHHNEDIQFNIGLGRMSFRDDNSGESDESDESDATATTTSLASSSNDSLVDLPRNTQQKLFYINYVSKNNSNILTPDMIDWIRNFESKLTNASSFSTYCMSPYIDTLSLECERPYSIANYFEPISTTTYVDSIITDSYNQTAPRWSRVVAVLQYLSQHGLSWHFDSSFNQTNLHSTIIRSEFVFARPVKGFLGVADNPSKQDAMFKSFLKNEFVPTILNNLNRDDIQIIYHGDVISDMEVFDALTHDAFVAMGACGAIFLLICLHTGSILVGIAGMIQIVFAIGTSLFFYYVVVGFDFFGVLNILSVFIILGIAADNIFIFTDHWKLSKSECVDPNGRLYWVFGIAGNAMLVTTFTNAIVFLGTWISPAEAFQAFGCFSFFLIIFNYIYQITYFPAALLCGEMLSKWVSTKLCCRRKKKQQESVVLHDGSDVGLFGMNKLTQKIRDFSSGPLTTLLAGHKARSIASVLFCILIVAGSAVVIGFGLRLSSSDVKLFRSSVNLQKALDLRNSLSGGISQMPLPLYQSFIHYDPNTLMTKYPPSQVITMTLAMDISQYNELDFMTTWAKLFSLSSAAQIDVYSATAGSTVITFVVHSNDIQPSADVDIVTTINNLAETGQLRDNGVVAITIAGHDIPVKDRSATTAPQATTSADAYPAPAPAPAPAPSPSGGAAATTAAAAAAPPSPTSAANSTAPSNSTSGNNTVSLRMRLNAAGNNTSAANVTATTTTTIVPTTTTASSSTAGGANNPTAATTTSSNNGGGGIIVVQGSDTTAAAPATTTTAGITTTAKPLCPNNCNNQGSCVINSIGVHACACTDPSYGGLDCSVLISKDLPDSTATLFSIVWGITGSKIKANSTATSGVMSVDNLFTSDDQDPVFDSAFNISLPSSQTFLLSACDRARRGFADIVRGQSVIPQFVCWPEIMNAYLTQNKFDPLPLQPDVFNQMLLKFVKSSFFTSYSCDSDMGLDPATGQMLWSRIRLVTNVDKTVPATIGQPYLNRFQDLVDTLNADAPSTSAGTCFSVSELAISVSTEYAARQQFWQELWMNCVVAFGCVLLFTGSLVLSLMASATIGVIMCTLLAILVFLGWKIGLVEAMTLMLLVGFSVDYTIHVALAYIHAHNAPTKLARMRNAVHTIGLSLLGSTVTTAGAACFLLLSNFDPFVKVGTVIGTNITLSLLYTIIFLLPMMALFAPKDPGFPRQLKASCTKIFKSLFACCLYIPRAKPNPPSSPADKSTGSNSKELQESPFSANNQADFVYPNFDDSSNNNSGSIGERTDGVDSGDNTARDPGNDNNCSSNNDSGDDGNDDDNNDNGGGAALNIAAAATAATTTNTIINPNDMLVTAFRTNVNASETQRMMEARRQMIAFGANNEPPKPIQGIADECWPLPGILIQPLSEPVVDGIPLDLDVVDPKVDEDSSSLPPYPPAPAIRIVPNEDNATWVADARRSLRPAQPRPWLLQMDFPSGPEL